MEKRNTWAHDENRKQKSVTNDNLPINHVIIK